MSLRLKTVLLLCSVVITYAVFDCLVQGQIVAGSFSQLEREEAEKDLHRVVEAVQSEVDHLGVRCRQWAAWDDTYRYVQDPYDAYESSNLGETLFRDQDINLLYVCAADGRVVWGEVQDLATGRSISLRDFPREALHPTHWVVQHDAPDSAIQGIYLTELGPLLLSSRPIVRSNGEGPVRGTLVLGKLLNDELIARLSEQTSVPFEVWPVLSDLGPEEAEVLDEATSSPRPVIREAEDQLAVYTTVDDINHAPELLVRAQVGRAISARGDTAARYALISTVAAGLVILLVFLMLIGRTVLTPIAKLTAHAVQIGKDEDFSAPLNLQRNDEIGILSRELDSMMEKLMHSREALVTAARLAGMSEIATGVLHNVGNVLNSVNVSANLVANKLRNSEIRDLLRLAEVVEKNKDDLAAFVSEHPQGKHLQPFLCELTEQLVAEHGDMGKEMAELVEGIEHIKKLVNSQQTFAGKSKVLEPVSVSEQVEGALSISRQAGGSREVDVRVVRELADLPRMMIDKHKLMEVLVNLIQNARQAMYDAGVQDPTLTMRSLPLESGGIRIEIADNGPGISKENLARIFNHGFTTKKNGHGFGLHSSANAATEMGGRLWAESDGIGCGATFILELPTSLAKAA